MNRLMPAGTERNIFSGDVFDITGFLREQKDYGAMACKYANSLEHDAPCSVRPGFRVN